MPLLSQAALAVTILVSTFGTFAALTPPNPNPKTKKQPANDLIHGLLLTHRHSTKVLLSPIGLLAVQAASLAWNYPDIPPSRLGQGVANGFNPALITWSASTAIPLALILFVGVPLRLIPYAALGKNFTFALAEPDRLTTSGMYRFVQHPSYTGIAVLGLVNGVLLCRMDGVITTWFPAEWFGYVQILAYLTAPLGCSAAMALIWTRVKEEEAMLRDRFGKEWEIWHAKTARFIPGVF